MREIISGCNSQKKNHARQGHHDIKRLLSKLQHPSFMNRNWNVEESTPKIQDAAVADTAETRSRSSTTSRDNPIVTATDAKCLDIPEAQQSKVQAEGGVQMIRYSHFSTEEEKEAGFSV